MSRILSFSANESTLTANYFPPIDLATPYECGLVSLFTYNSIPNVDQRNNLFHVGNHIIVLPEGAYELEAIAEYIDTYLKEKKSNIVVNLRPNVNTLKTELKSTHPVYFNKERSIGSLLGFSKRVIEPNRLVQSDLNVNINSVSSIRVECSIITGAYHNNTLVHTIHEFSPNVLPGYKINEVPKNIVYLPVNGSSINSITVKLVDQDGQDLNFRNEKITIILHLRPSSPAA